MPNFSPIGARICVSWWILQNVRKEEEKTRKTPQTLAAHISEMAGAISSNFECALPYLVGTSVETLVSIGSGITERQRCENCVFFLLIYSRCGTPASWAARHITMCLDTLEITNNYLNMGPLATKANLSNHS